MLSTPPLTIYNQVINLLTSLPTFESVFDRLLVSALVVLIGSILGVVIIPGVVRSVSRVVNRWIDDHTDSDVIESVRLSLSDDTGIQFWTILTFRTITAIGISVALLAIWGRSQAAITLLTELTETLPKIGRAIITIFNILAAYLGSRLIDQSLERINETDRWDDHRARMVLRSAQVIMFIVLGAITLSVWKIDISGLIVGAGFFGIIVGMATRQTIGALVAGFVLMFSRPFRVGDWIEVGNHRGVVVDITMVNTRLENEEGVVIVLPNDIVSESVVRNLTRNGRVRETVEVGIDYEVDPSRAEQVAEEAMRNLDDVRSVPAPEAVPVSFDGSQVNLELRFWIGNPSARRVIRTQADVIRGVKQAFESEGIDIPFPQRTLHFRGDEDDDLPTDQTRIDRVE